MIGPCAQLASVDSSWTAICFVPEMAVTAGVGACRCGADRAPRCSSGACGQATPRRFSASAKNVEILQEFTEDGAALEHAAGR
jgi:hypothetical protein